MLIWSTAENSGIQGMLTRFGGRMMRASVGMLGRLVNTNAAPGHAPAERSLVGAYRCYGKDFAKIKHHRNLHCPGLLVAVAFRTCTRRAMMGIPGSV
jgi:hypothetical protein